MSTQPGLIHPEAIFRKPKRKRSLHPSDKKTEQPNHKRQKKNRQHHHPNNTTSAGHFSLRFSGHRFSFARKKAFSILRVVILSK